MSSFMSGFKWRRVDIDTPDWKEEFEQSVNKGRKASQYEGHSLLFRIVFLQASAAGALLLISGITDTFWIVLSIFISATCVCYAIANRTVGIETSLAIAYTMVELYGNQISKQLARNDGLERPPGSDF